MAIDPSISLAVKPFQVQSPLDALEKNVRVADMISVMHERQQMGAERAATTKLRQTEATTAQKDLEDRNALEQASQKYLKYDPDSDEPLSYDTAGVTSELQKMGKGYLAPKFLEQRDAFRKKHSDQAIAELEDAHKMTEALGVPAQNFLDLPDEQKVAQYPALVQTLSKVNPMAARQLPAQYDPSALAKVQEIVDHRNQIRSTADKLKEAQAREALQNAEDAKLSIEDLWKKNGGTGLVPPEYRDKVIAQRTGITAPAASSYKDLKFTEMDGDKLPANAEDRDGAPVPAEWKTDSTRFEKRQAPDGRIYYQVTKSPAKNTKEKEHERINRLYAFSIGKNVADLTPADEAQAEVWHSKLLPTKATEIDKRIALYNRDPKMYGAIFGHGADQDKPITKAQKAAILGRINAEIDKQGLSGKEATDFKKARYDELRDAGVEMDPTKVAPPTPTPAAGRVAKKADVEAAATKAGIPYGELKRRIEAQGGKVQE